LRVLVVEERRIVHADPASIAELRSEARRTRRVTFGARRVSAMVGYWGFISVWHDAHGRQHYRRLRGHGHIHGRALRVVLIASSPCSWPCSRNRRCTIPPVGERRSSTLYSMISSARNSSGCGIFGPSGVLAVFRLITSSNLVACSTGRSAGLAPLRILST